VLSTFEATAWIDRAACRGIGVELFYYAPHPDDQRRRKALCASCPVLLNCRKLVDRIERDKPQNERHCWGYWAGQTAKERIARRAARRARLVG
jgi:WhiB family transcriptional regulator, redox-sensing transcriptional regulator